MTPLSFIYRAWRYRLRLDVAEIAYIRRKVTDGMTVFDIGAHKGGYLYWLRNRVGSTGTVVAFEPQPLLNQYLSSVVAKANYQNVTVEPMALSSQIGNLTLFVPQHGSKTSPGATLNAAKPQEIACETVEVVVDTLDNYCEKHGLQPDFLKIDVEGFELHVFKGAKNILAARKTTLFFECEQRHLGSTKIDDVFDFLSNLGYKGYFFEHEKLTAIEHFSIEKHQKIVNNKVNSGYYCNNFVFEPT